MPKVALGKGLGALINTRVASQTTAPEHGERVQLISLSEIMPTPLQPRTEFGGERLQELIDSIRIHGIIQPLFVRRSGDKYELIAGERRWRAAKEVGLTEAPVIVREATDQEVFELALIENIQREDLNPVEEALAYTRLAQEFKLKQEEIAQKVGKNRVTIANSMRLLELHPQIQSWLVQGLVSVGHGKVLLGLKTHDEQLLIAQIILRNNYTVRRAEKLVDAHLSQHGTVRRGRSAQSASPSLTPALQHLQNRLQKHFATHVTVQHSEKQGRIEIEYYGTDDLNRLLEVIRLPDET